MTILLSGIVGSTAYGLATPESDIDRAGIFAVPTKDLLSLHPPGLSRKFGDGDGMLHEAGKYLSLALKSNPSVLEVLWLPDDLYEIRLPLGDRLIAIRDCFPSRTMVRNAYLGYATAQFRKMEEKGAGNPRTAKHARHLARLLIQGYQLYAEGTLTVRVDDPDWYRQFGEDAAAGDLIRARVLIASTENSMDMTTSPLPEKPDEEKAEAWLQEVRREFY